MALIFIVFIMIAAVGGAHLSWSMMDSLIRRMRIEPRDWVIQRLRALSE